MTIPNEGLSMFKNKKPVIGTINLKGSSSNEIDIVVKKEIDILINNQVDGIIIENYAAMVNHMKQVLKYLSTLENDIVYGVNPANFYSLAFELANEYNAKFILLNSVAGHLSPVEDDDFGNWLYEKKLHYNVPLWGGVRYRYSKIYSGRTEENDLKIAKTRCDAIVTGKSGIDRNDIDHLKKVKAMIKDFTLIANGITLDNCINYLKIADALLVDYYFKDSYHLCGTVSESHVQDIMKKVKMVRNKHF